MGTRSVRTAIALAVALCWSIGAAAATATGPSIEVIAAGLDNPRGLVATHGEVLVAEAGRDGPGPSIVGSDGVRVCLGQTGAVTAVRPGGKGMDQRRVVTGLPSLAPEGGAGATGPHDVAVGDKELLVTLGLAADPALRADLGPGGALLGRLVGVRPPAAAVRSIADLAAFEAAADPDQGLPGTAPDSNPYGLLATPGGALVTDAGGNTLVRVGPKGVVSAVAVLAPRLVPGPMPGSMIPMQSVPTTVARGPDGALYVGELTGFPFPVGGARILRIAKGAAPEVVAEGFTNVIDIAFDDDGRLHVLEFARNGLLSMDPAGALTRIEPDGSRTEIAAGALIAPGGIAFGRDGTIYVSNKSVLPGGGEILRIRHA